MFWTTDTEERSCGRQTVGKAVAGSSRTFDLGPGLLVGAEYHYSGFGQANPSRGDPMGDRYLRGDSQILGRHATCIQLVWGLGTTMPVSLSWIASPTDGSGVVTMGATWECTDHLTFVTSASLAHGARPRDGDLRSEYGATPRSVLVGIRFYA